MQPVSPTAPAVPAAAASAAAAAPDADAVGKPTDEIDVEAPLVPCREGRESPAAEQREEHEKTHVPSRRGVEHVLLPVLSGRPHSRVAELPQ